MTDARPLTGDQLDGMFEFPQYYQVFRDVFQQGLSTDRIDSIPIIGSGDKYTFICVFRH